MEKNIQTAPNNKTPWILIVLLVVAAFFIGSLFTKVQYLEKAAKTPTTDTAVAPQQPTVSLTQIKDVFSKNVIKFGDAKRKLLFIEVADPSCPYCSVAAGENGELNKQVGDRFKLVADGGTYVAPVPEMKKLLDQGKASYAYIYFPGHGNGEMGMKALYCASESGKYWEVHSLIMGGAGYDLMNNTVKNDKTKSAEVADLLKNVTDPAQMKLCLDSGKYDKRLTDDAALASSLGINGTPGFFVNETNFAGAYSYTDMQETVNKALGK